MHDANCRWRGEFTNEEVNRLHADAFGHRVFDETEWDWVALTVTHSLGWVTARSGGNLVGFVNVLWDGLVHAWLQDEMVASSARHRGIGVGLVAVVCDEAKAAGCEWLHVDFDEDLRPFYIDAAGFTPTSGGLIDLTGAHEEALVLGEQAFDVQEGELTDVSSWVYVWMRAEPPPRVVYVGATSLPPIARAWLHLNHDDPDIGRIRSQHPEALSGALKVHAFRLNSALDRQAVKDTVITLLDKEEGSPSQLHEDDTVLAAAHDIVDRLRARQQIT